ncbi:MAG TPA: glycosyltransferase family 2 protein [Pedobacter sp.]|uniref:glycosyltransferase family 2 protein n=1 Tax=Pedobacter sp. TaxID=1411316 RepID=UPI002BB99AE9|nr:glycosyltransferase family 2 protein [Pedobacter sp.]HMI01440.1 glycosyltransferase family 2 protein [Pedobacter sp.]
MKHIAIVIPIYNRLEVTKIGLKHISKSVDFYHAAAGERKYEVSIVIVDDGSTDGSPDWIEASYPKVTVLRSGGDLWWTGAVNFGIDHCIKQVTGLEAIILQNDDVIVDEDWLLNLIDAANANPNSLIGCATSTMDNKDKITYGGRKLHSWFAREEMLNLGLSKYRFPKGYVTPSFDLYGRGIYIPVGVFQKIGLFNQDQFKHRGDMDIPLRAKKAGFKLLVSYDAMVYEFPEHAFGLDSKKKISLKEAFKALTDFRSSNNLKFVYYYSLQATRNPLQFTVFFCSNLFYNMRRICWRVVNQYV